MPALGEQFRAAREARGLSLSEVAEQIRIRSVYLAEIEAENWGAIGAPVYVRGFLRTYARFLGLDAEEAVAGFNKTSPAAPVSESVGISNTAVRADTEPRNLSPLLWIATGVAIILVGFVIYNYAMLRSPGSRGTVAAGSAVPATPVPSGLPSNSPGASAVPAVTASPSLKQTLQVNVVSGSWLRVTVDGNVRIEGTFPKGTTKVFHGRIALVRVGNAGGVDVIVNGKRVGPLGKTGDVVDRSFTL